MKRILPYLLIMVLLGASSAAWGQEDNQGAGTDPDSAYAEIDEGMGEPLMEEEAEPPAAHYALEPEFRTWLGYNYVSLEGSTRAAEYIWPHSSVTGGLVLHYTPLPRRMDFELDWKNIYDYQSEFAYAYKDMFKLDYRGWSLYHNLDHYMPLYTPAAVDLAGGQGVFYHATSRDNRIFLRLKWPDRAYHAFAEYRQFDKEGTIQQRFYSAVTKTSRSRDIEWTTRKYTAGINGHLGPIEAEYTHRIKTFDPHKDVTLTDTIAGAPHDHAVVPKLEGHSDNIKIHTDLTGRIVASVTLTAGEKNNKHTRAEVDYSRAYADLVLIPFKDLTVAFKYRFNDLQTHVPDVVGASVFGAPGFTHDPMDRMTHTGEVVARYSPTINFSVKAGYKFENIKRDNAKSWSETIAAGPPVREVFPYQDIPYVQNVHQVSLGVNTRPLTTVSVKGSLTYTYCNDPAYPTDPNNSYKGRFDAVWTPVHDVMADAYYRFVREENDTANMNADRDNAGALVTWTPAQRLSLYANYDYSRYKNERDIRLLSGVFPTEAPYPTHSVPYTDTSHLYSVGMGYAFVFPLTLNTEFHQCWSRSAFRTAAFEPVNNVTSDGLGELTDVKIRETGGSVRAGYDFPKGWGASAEYSVTDYQDLQDKPQNGLQDGIVHSVMLLVKKEW